jgi:hypothetical protein
MRGASTLRRVGGSMVVAAALAGATAGSASAMAMPECATVLAPGAASSSCGFGNISTSYAMINVEPVGTVTATVRCFTSWGTTYTSSRTVSSRTTWTTYAPGSGCSLILTPVSAGAGAVGSASPGVGPIIQPPPGP